CASRSLLLFCCCLPPGAPLSFPSTTLFRSAGRERAAGRPQGCLGRRRGPLPRGGPDPAGARPGRGGASPPPRCPPPAARPPRPPHPKSTPLNSSHLPTPHAPLPPHNTNPPL